MSTILKPNPALVRAISLLRAITTRYTRHHADLKVEGREMGAVLTLTIQGHKDDHPKLVGSKGQHIIALQTIFAAVSRRSARTIRLTLLDPSKGQKMETAEYRENPNWTPDSTVALLEQILLATTSAGATIEPQDCGALTTMVITPGSVMDPCARWIDGTLKKALHFLIHAIGKTEGREIHVEVLDPTTGQPVNGPAL